MKTKKPMLKRLGVVASIWVWCALNLHGQSAPTITTQPASQTNLVGSNVTFSVAVDGTGPFTYQWQFNGTNVPTPNNTIVTVAGGGSGGDGGLATNASLSSPKGVAWDGCGNLYIADSLNQRIRKVDTNGIITTVAGTNSAGFSGDMGPAANAKLNYPCGVDLDAVGNLYIADNYNQRIRQVDTNGIITTVAGRNSAGNSGDGGAATNAFLDNPVAVALDATGDLYIADAFNQRIREVGTNGIITGMAGKGAAGYSGDGGAATNASLNSPGGVALDAAGNVFIGDTSNNRIRKVDLNGVITTLAGGGSGGDGGAATNASLNSPCGVALDGFGNLYIADYGNQRVRKVDTNGIITTVAGKTGAGYSGDGGAATNASLDNPVAVALDSVGNLYIADASNNRIRKVNLATYPTLVFTNVSAANAGSYAVVITSPYGSVTSAVAVLTMVYPASIAVQPVSQRVLTGSNATLSAIAAGTLPLYYSWWFNTTNLVDSGTSASFMVSNLSASNAGGYAVVVTNAYGSVTSAVAMLTLVFAPSVTNQPVSLAVLAGTNVTLSVTLDGTCPFNYVWQLNGTNLPNNDITIATVAGDGAPGYSGDGGSATGANLSEPVGVALDGCGNLYIADNLNSRIRKVDTNGIISTVAGNGSKTYSGDGGPATNASLSSPAGVAVDAAGNIYIADEANQRIRKVDTTGIISTVAGNGNAAYSGDGGVATNASLKGPYGVALDGFGNLYIADEGNNRIRKVDASSTITTVAGNGNAAYAGDGGAATNASLHFPYGVGLDSAGNLYIADMYNQRLRMVDTSGVITTVAGNGSGTYAGDGGAATNGSLYRPTSVALDFSGNLYIADCYNECIRKVDRNGIITTVAGTFIFGYAGDGGAATNARFHYPVGVAADAVGNLYIADSLNERVREIQFAGYPTFALTNVSVASAGNYTVVVTSPYGSVTSAVATLTVFVPPQIITGDGFFGFMTNQFGFNVRAAAGQTIVVDGSTDLVNWTPVFTNTVVVNPFYFCDPCWSNSPWRFYRARLP